MATARKIASIYYKMVTEKADFDPQVLQNKTHEYLERKLQNLEKSIQRSKILLTDSKVVSASVI